MLERLKASLPTRLLMAFGASNAGNFAAGLAYNAFLSMFPLILGLLSIAGFVIRDSTQQARLRGAMIAAFPAEAQAQILQALESAQQNAGLLGILSLAGLVISGSSLFSSMEFALDQIYGLKQRGFIRQKAMALGMMLLFVVALVVAVAANSLVGLVPGISALGSVVGVLLGALVMIALLIAIYRIVPNRKFRLGEVWPGALVAGVGIEGLNLAFPIYGRVSHGFNTYGQAFAIFFLLSAWLGLLCQLLLLGAVLNKLIVDERPALAAPAQGSGTGPAPEQPRRGRLIRAGVWILVLMLALWPFRRRTSTAV